LVCLVDLKPDDANRPAASKRDRVAWSQEQGVPGDADRPRGGSVLPLEEERVGRHGRNLRDYEAILAKLALDHADLELSEFEPPVGTERLREFIDSRWGERTARTRGKVISVLRDFFAWAVREAKLSGNPALAIVRPRKREVARGTFTAGDVRKLIAAQPRQRDRVAVLLLFRLGLRKGELCRVQFAHYDGRNLTVFGKGGKVRYLPVVDSELRLGGTSSTANPTPQSSCSTRKRLGPEFYGGPVGVIWEDRHRPLSSTAMHRWWTKGLERAGLPHRPTHEARHTAITEFLRRTGNMKLAQMLAGHAAIGTTANIYAHLDTSDLENRAQSAERGAATLTRRNRSDRKPPICGDYGGGGNRTRVRGRTGQSVYKRRLPLKFARRPVGSRPTPGLVILCVSHVGR
jgi:integrase